MNIRKLLLSPHGRIGRQSFWTFVLLLALVGAVANILELSIFGSANSGFPISTIIYVVTFIPNVFVQTKRLHDLGRSGWLQIIPQTATVVADPLFTPDAPPVVSLLLIIPAIVMLIWLGFFKGQPGPNKYGEPNSGDRDVTPVVEVFS